MIHLNWKVNVEVINVETNPAFAQTLTDILCKRSLHEEIGEQCSRLSLIYSSKRLPKQELSDLATSELSCFVIDFVQHYLCFHLKGSEQGCPNSTIVVRFWVLKRWISLFTHNFFQLLKNIVKLCIVLIVQITFCQEFFTKYVLYHICV